MMIQLFPLRLSWVKRMWFTGSSVQGDFKLTQVKYRN